MLISDDDAIHIALLPDPDAALDFLELLEDGNRPALAARKVSLSESTIRKWREASEAFNRMCTDAEAIGVAMIDDVVVTHIRAGTPGWSGAAKLILQRRDRAYGDKHEITGANGAPINNVTGIDVDFIGVKK